MFAFIPGLKSEVFPLTHIMKSSFLDHNGKERGLFDEGAKVTIHISDVDMYYQNAFGELGISLKETDRQDLAVATSGSPFLMQLLGHYITISANTDGQLTADSILSAKRHALADYRRDICETTLAPLSDADVTFLTAMAEDEKESEPASLAARMGVTSSYIQTYKRRLLQTGIIEQPARGKLRFAVPYLPDYLVEQNI